MALYYRVGDVIAHDLPGAAIRYIRVTDRVADANGQPGFCGVDVITGRVVLGYDTQIVCVTPCSRRNEMARA